MTMQGDPTNARRRAPAPRPFPVADERRATIQAMNAWMAARGGSDLPDVGALFDGSRQICDSEFLVMIDRDTLDSVFIVCGADIPLRPGERGVGNSVARAMEPSQRDMFRAACGEAVRDGAAVYREGTIKTATGAAVSYRCSFMPMRSGNEAGNMYIFGAYGSKTGTARARDAA